MELEVCNVGPIKGCLDLEVGNLTLLVGPNSSGKSTVLRSLYALTKKNAEDAAKVLYNTFEDVHLLDTTVKYGDSCICENDFKPLDASASYASATRVNALSLAPLLEGIEKVLDQMNKLGTLVGAIPSKKDLGTQVYNLLKLFFSDQKGSSSLYYLQEYLNPIDVDLALKLRAVFNDQNLKEELKRLLEQFHYIEDPLEPSIPSVAAHSSGSLYLVPILAALVSAKDYLLVDEPESHLEIPNQAKLVKLLADKALKGLKVLVSTHSSTFVAALATYSYHLDMDVSVYEFVRKGNAIKVIKRERIEDVIPIERMETWLHKINWERWWEEVS